MILLKQYHNMSNEKELCKICEEGYLINCNDYIALPESGLTFLVPSDVYEKHFNISL